jgi:hypothetical protein
VTPVDRFGEELEYFREKLMQALGLAPFVSPRQLDLPFPDTSGDLVPRKAIRSRDGYLPWYGKIAIHDPGVQLRFPIIDCSCGCSAP